jgi:hypothetical protein
VKLPGYCTECRRVRQVEVKILVNPQMPMGVCQQCQDKAKEKK